MNASSVGIKRTRLPFWRQLRWNLTFFFLILAIVPLIAVQAFTLNQSSEQAKKQVLNQLESIGNLKFNQIQQWLGDDHQILTTILDPYTAITYAQLIDLPSPDVQSTIHDSLAGEVKRTSQAGLFDKFIIYDASGNIVAGSDSTDVGKTVNTQPYFQTSLGSSYTQPPYYDTNTRKLTIVQTQPIMSITGNQVIGVLAGILDVPRLGQIMTESSGLGQTGETYLVSKANNGLVTPSRFEANAVDSATTAHHSQGIDNALQGQTGTSQYTDFRGETVLGYYRWIPELQVGLLSEQGESEALASSQNVFNNSLLILLVVSLIAIIVGVVRITQISRPVGELTEIASQIAGGNLNLRAAMKQRNEVGLLADAFNQMTTQLIQNIRQLDQRVAEVNKINQELKTATALANESARVKGEFLSTMSHELRTPLNAIEGFTSIMLSTMGASLNLSPAAKNMVERISANSKRLLGLINDFLDLSRIDSGRLNLVNSPIVIDELVRRWTTQVSGLAEQKKLAFIVKLAPNMPPTILGDEEALTKMVVNLLGNAIKFTASGSVTLEIGLTDAKHFMIEVRDTGIGIPSHAHEYIFEEFRQVDSSSKRQYGGTGLGLSIVQKLSRAMGGTVTLQSEVGRGSTFAISLPLTEPEPVMAEEVVTI